MNTRDLFLRCLKQKNPDLQAKPKNPSRSINLPDVFFSHFFLFHFSASYFINSYNK
jgi:hypothetical protein